MPAQFSPKNLDEINIYVVMNTNVKAILNNDLQISAFMIMVET